MSQNKTIVPGMDFMGNNGGADDFYASLYNRTGSDQGRTSVPDIAKPSTPMPLVSQPVPDVSATSTPIATQALRSSKRQVVFQERVVVGVLFSVSRGLLGELFPVYLGKNIIGQDPDCDIILSERNVSAHHAILFVRDGEDGCDATITDFNSTYGTRVNDEDARYDTVNVHDDDILTVGNHYQLVVKFFNAFRRGLTEDADFEDPESFSDIPGVIGGGMTPVDDFYRPSNREDDSSTRTVIC